MEHFGQFLVEAEQCGAFGVISFRQGSVNFPKLPLLSGEGTYSVIFWPQRLESIAYRAYKALELEIIDRIIVYTQQTPHKIVGILPTSSGSASEMLVRVNRIYWNFKRWDEEYVTLRSDDKINVKMTIGKETFDLSYEQLINIFH